MLKLKVDSPEERLVVYGSLAPGGVNAFILAPLEGTWERCLIRGRMGRYRGFKYFRYDRGGEEHSAWLFTSPALPTKFPELDDFEGDEFQRILIPALVEGQEVMANVYEGKYDI
jgi:hypothetical protein